MFAQQPAAVSIRTAKRDKFMRLIPNLFVFKNRPDKARLYLVWIGERRRTGCEGTHYNNARPFRLEKQLELAVQGDPPKDQAQGSSLWWFVKETQLAFQQETQIQGSFPQVEQEAMIISKWRQNDDNWLQNLPFIII